MNILFLFPYPGGTAPSQRFRFEQYYHFLEGKDITYHQQSFLDEKTWAILYKKGDHLAKARGIVRGFFRRFRILFTLKKYDVVFIHREASPVGPPVFEWLITRVFRKKVIFDFDDAVWLPNTSANNSIAARIKFHSKTKHICKWASKISAGNDYLCAYARQYNTHVVLNPTTIDTENWHNRLKDQDIKKGQKLVIGWTGSHSTMKYLEGLIPVLQELEKQYSFEFLVISNKKPLFRLKSLKYIKWNKDTEIEDLLQINVGVMPLSDDLWAQGKCGFKALQYMALGIPALVSPVGVNTKIVDHAQNGFLCETQEDWRKYLKLLLESDKLRKELGAKARQKIEDAYSVKANQNNFTLLLI